MTFDADRVQLLEAQLATERVIAAARSRAALMLIDALEDQRDRARRIAVRLEQENAELTRQLDELIELIEVDGDAQLALELKAAELRSRHE